MSAHADDIVVMGNGQRYFDVLTDIINDFNILSSAKVNWKKVKPFESGTGQVWNQAFQTI